MHRTLLVFSTLVLLAGAACGSDKPPAAQEREREVDATPARTARAVSDSDLDDVATGAGSDAFGSAFDPLFGSAFAAGLDDETGVLEGDPAMLDLLPEDSELPPGFTSQGEYTYRLPEDTPVLGGIDMAGKAATFGETDSAHPLDGSTMLMISVMRFDDAGDAQRLVAQFERYDEDYFDDALGDGGAFGFEDAEVDLLDASSLGDDAGGFEYTIDMSGLLDALGDLGDDEASAELAGFSSTTMRMYWFARGAYAVSVMRIAFGDGAGSASEDLALTASIQGRLP